jgi:AraC-like DNA-binding protein
LFNEVIALQGIVYSIFATRLIRKYQNKIKDYESSVEKGIIRVLYIGISLNLLSWILGIIDLHLGYFNIETGIDLFAYTYLILVLVIYVISYAALKSPEIFKLELDTGKIQGLGIRKLVGGVKVTNPINYKNNSTANIIEEVSTPDSNLDDLNRQLIGFMEEDKPYLNPELSLPALAQSLDIPRNQLSTVINQVHQKNFYEFVNQYRIDEVKKLMTNPSNKHLKLMSLAYDAGFNSKATFNRIFKQMTKLTPSEYISKQNGD